MSGNEAKRVAAMPVTEQQAYRDILIGTAEVAGEVSDRPASSQPSDPVLRYNLPLTALGTVWMGGADLKTPITLRDGEGAVVLAFRRTDPISLGKTAHIDITRYDLNTGELAEPTKDPAKSIKAMTYGFRANSRDKNAQYEIQIYRLTPGDYIISNESIGPSFTGSGNNCMGAPVFHVPSGQFVYLGDFTTYMSVQLNNGRWIDALLAWSAHLDDVRRELAGTQPEMAQRLIMANIRNGATYRCLEEHLGELDFPGVPSLGKDAGSMPQ